MIFRYHVTGKDGDDQKGTIDAANIDSAITSLQKRNFVVLSIVPDKGVSWSEDIFKIFDRVKSRDIVILSRQISTLFEAKVPVLSAFQLLASEASSNMLKKKLVEITDDIKGGAQISQALTKQPDIFSEFYVAMIRSGEETGRLSEAFTYLANYMERQHVVASKVKNALIYPAFVILSFIGVMVLMMVMVIPQFAAIIKDTGQAIPWYTKLIIGASDFLIHYGLFLLIALSAGGVLLWRYGISAVGKQALSELKLQIPYLGLLYRKLYLSRIADNLSTMVESGISMVRALEITAEVVDSETYKNILKEAGDKVKAGTPVSQALAVYPEIPGIIIQMMKVGEESGKFGYVLSTMAKFYEREVENAVDTLVSLIEPAMIIILGAGVGILLTAVLMPIYDIAGSIS